ncbi:HAMP domain-containing sensor histidine kinase [Streptomyces sp. NPDC051940]|uniref:sensor histidine kinase n=1 Tax=Streptomyces sp. NPDC051940 TaxID=3155675 RepID=UPI0034389F1E
MTRRFRSLPLRSRLALLTACAVAVAVAVVSLACWVIVRDRLISQVDDSLRRAGSGAQDIRIPQRLVCRSEPAEDPFGLPAQAAGPVDGTAQQLVLGNGKRCLLSGEGIFTATKTDTDVAASGGDPAAPPGEQAWALHTITSDGTKLRVYTQATGQIVDSADPELDGQPIAYSVSRPLTDTLDALSNLAWLLTAVAGAGVLVAGAAGLTVARAGLRPVDRLTDTVEHIAQTEDLSVRIPVEGDDEIARLSRSFNAMTESLASSRDRQQQLVADAGHELRTPLTSLRTNIELLARSEESGRPIPPDDRRELLASVKAQMTELAALIGDLQELSRPDADPDRGPLQVVGLHDIAERAVVRARLRGAGIEIAMDLAPWFVRAEPASLERALVNLLDNAVKFSPPGAAVDVRLKDGELTVRDHGPGIPPDELPHVFERFWRSPGARSLPGSGLGLSIVARTVQQSGGTVHLTPAEGGGTLAVLRLPGAATPPPDTAATAGELPQTGEGPAAG